MKEPSSTLYKNRLDEIEANQPFPHSPRRDSNEINPILKENSSQLKSKDLYNSERRMSYGREPEYHYNDNQADIQLNEASPPRFDYLRRDSEPEKYHQQTPEPENIYRQDLSRNSHHEDTRNFINTNEKQQPQESENQYVHHLQQTQQEERTTKYDPCPQPGIHRRTEPENQHNMQPEGEQYQYYPLQSQNNYPQTSHSQEQPAVENKYQQYINLFKKAVFSQISKGASKFNEEFLLNLKTETLNFKANIVYDKMAIKIEKYRFRSQLAEDLAKSFENKGIRLNSLNIGCNDKLYQQKSKCLFDNNQEAIEYFIKGFKTADMFPTLDQLSMIIEFHQENRFKFSICENTIKKYVLAQRKPMIEKQYFIQWMTEIFGLNFSSILSSPIDDPGCLEDHSDFVQIRLMALLCLFYNSTPSELMDMQLFSVVYLKPNFCFKSHCGNFLLILPTSYSSYMNRLISESQTCEMKSCFSTIKDEEVRTFCYHGKNLLFGSIK